MPERSHRERVKTCGNWRAVVWRDTRQLLAVTVVALLVSGSLLVRVEAAAGNLDTTFSLDGRQTANFGSDFGSEEPANAVAIQTDGKIVAAGFTTRSSGLVDFAVARYNIDGKLDTTFSRDGKQTTDFFGGKDYAYALAIQPDGKIIMAGDVEVGGHSKFGMARYQTDGTLDTTFSTDGKVTTNFSVESVATSIIIQPDGKIVLGGFTRGSNQVFALARYNSNGTLDTTFSGDGKQTTNISGSDAVTAIALQSNGRIVAAGTDGGGRFALVRYTNSGTLDKTFSGDGKQITDIGGYAQGRAVAIQPDGKIVVAGYVTLGGSPYDFALARYNSNGGLDNGSVTDITPDDAFGTNGIVTTDFFASSDGANAVAIQPNGKIVAAGFAYNSNNTNVDFALARYDVDGTADDTLSGDGKQNTTFFGRGQDEAKAIAIQSDGRIVLAGIIQKSSDYDFGLARYLGD